jgi:hypothetical protein
MSEPATPVPELPDATRDDEDDYDLLTYSEAGVRLQEEIAKEEARLPGLSGDEAAALRQRIAALREARERNGRRRLNDETFERFFGFRSRNSTPS